MCNKEGDSDFHFVIDFFYVTLSIVPVVEFVHGRILQYFIKFLQQLVSYFDSSDIDIFKSSKHPNSSKIKSYLRKHASTIVPYLQASKDILEIKPTDLSLLK